MPTPLQKIRHDLANVGFALKMVVEGKKELEPGDLEILQNSSEKLLKVLADMDALPELAAGMVES